MTREWRPGVEAKSLRRCRDGVISTELVSLHVDGRPWVAIDPEDCEQVERILSAYYSFQAGRPDGSIRRLQTALREFASPTPPRPEEPTGLGAVVEDERGERWIRRGAGPSWWIHSEGKSFAVKWDAMKAVHVLSEGVTP